MEHRQDTYGRDFEQVVVFSSWPLQRVPGKRRFKGQEIKWDLMRFDEGSGMRYLICGDEIFVEIG